MAAEENPNFLIAMEEKDEEESKDMVPYITEDLIWDILTRIPADSLEDSFSYVCKQWWGIVHNPIFHKIHNPEVLSGILQHVITNNGDVKLRFMDLESLEKNKVRNLYNFNHIAKVLRVCNGLVLYKDYLENLYVANPRRKTGGIHLPKQNERSRLSRFCDLVYVPLSDKYKVVDFYYNLIDRCPEFKIQTLGTGSCSIRKIKDEPRLVAETRRFSYYKSCCVNGVLYMQFYWSYPVISLDVGDETTMHILERPPGDYNNSWILNMGGELRFVGCCLRKYDFWGLKEGRWVRELEITRPVDLKVFALYVVLSLNNGEVIVFDDEYFDRKLLLYYVKKREWKLVDIDPGNGCRYAKYFQGTHFNSLLSVGNLCSNLRD